MIRIINSSAQALSIATTLFGSKAKQVFTIASFGIAFLGMSNAAFAQADQVADPITQKQEGQGMQRLSSGLAGGKEKEAGVENVKPTNSGRVVQHTNLKMAGLPPDFKQMKEEKLDANGKVNDVLPEAGGSPVLNPKQSRQAKDDAHGLSQPGTQTLSPANATPRK